MGEITHAGNIAAGDLQTFYAGITLPNVTMGNWRFAVQVNVNRNILEGTSVDNNETLAAAQTMVTVPLLSLPKSGHLVNNSQSQLYKLVIPAGEEYYLQCIPEQSRWYPTLWETIDAMPPAKEIMILVREDFAPTSTLYDYSALTTTTLELFSGKDEFYNVYNILTTLYIPAADHERTFYLSMSTDSPTVNCVLERISGAFQVSRIEGALRSDDTKYADVESHWYYQSLVYNTTTSIKIIGTGFQEGMSASLVPNWSTWSSYPRFPPFPTIHASKITVLSPTEAVITFDMPDILIGESFDVYDLVVTSHGKTSRINESIFVHEEYYYLRYGSELNASIQLPESVREGRVYTGYIKYKEDFKDLLSPLFILQASDGTKLSLSPDSFDNATNTLQVMGISSSNPAGMLYVGDSGLIPFYFMAGSNPDISLGMLIYRDNEPCNDTTYFVTWKEYHEALANAVTRLNLRGKMVSDAQEVYQFAVMLHEGYDVNAITGKLENKNTGETLANVTLVAQWMDSQGKAKSATAITDENGWFSITGLPNDVTVTLESYDVTGLSKTRFVVGKGDINGVRLNAIPIDFSYRSTVAIADGITAYLRYKPGELSHSGSTTMSLVITNTSDKAVPAALLFLNATDSYGNEQAIMTLDPTLVGKGYSTSVMPDGFDSALQLLTGGATSGMIQPGETVTIPVFWGGWLKPWNSTHYTLSLSLITTSDTTALDLESMKTSMQPENMTESQWAVVWNRMKSMIGTT